MASSEKAPPSAVRDVVVRRAESDADIEAFKRTAEMYAQWIVDEFQVKIKNHQQFDAEMASLPAPYTPDGFILLAEIDNEVVGAIGAKPLPEAQDVGDAKVIELKRMFVREGLRGRGVGRALVRACVEGARSLGYTLIVLDTNKNFVSANVLYKSCGFKRRDFYLPGQAKVPKGEILAYEMPLHKAAEVVVRRAESDADIEAFKSTAKTHAQSMWDEFEIDLRKIQPFDAELASLPAPYSDGGFILLAEVHGELAGAIALKRRTDNIDIDPSERVCECKRLFVFHKFRGYKIGRQLVDACVDGAIELGYTLMVLDTANRWHAARAIYEKKGFKQCKPYFHFDFDPDDSPLKNGIVPLFYSMALRAGSEEIETPAKTSA